MHVYWWHKLYLIKYSVHVIKHIYRCGWEIKWIINKKCKRDSSTSSNWDKMNFEIAHLWLISSKANLILN